MAKVMIAEQKRSLIMLVLLFVMVFVYHLGHGFYYARGLEPLPTFDFLYMAGFLCGLVWCLRADIKRSPVVPVYCDGLLVGIGWLFLVPYHLFKTRGVLGFIPLLAFIGVVVSARILPEVVYLVFSSAL